MRVDGPVPVTMSCDRASRGPWPTYRITPSSAFITSRTAPANGLERSAGICLARTYAEEPASGDHQVSAVTNARHKTTPRHPSCVFRAAGNETQAFTRVRCFKAAQAVEHMQNRPPRITKMLSYHGDLAAHFVGAVSPNSVAGVTRFAGFIVSGHSESTR